MIPCFYWLFLRFIFFISLQVRLVHINKLSSYWCAHNCCLFARRWGKHSKVRETRSEKLATPSISILPSDRYKQEPLSYHLLFHSKLVHINKILEFRQTFTRFEKHHTAFLFSKFEFFLFFIHYFFPFLMMLTATHIIDLA